MVEWLIGLTIENRADPTGVVSKTIKATGNFGTRWMIDLINNISLRPPYPPTYTQPTESLQTSY